MPRPAIERSIGVLKWMPPDADFAIVTRRLSDGLALAREALVPLELLAQVDGAKAGSWLAGPFNPLEVGDWIDLGVDPEKSAGLFIDGTSITALFALTDADKLRQFWEEHQPDANIGIRRIDGLDVHEWTSTDLGQVSWVVMDRWLVLRVEAPKPEPARDTSTGTPDWLESMRARARGRSLSSHDPFVRLLEGKVTAREPQAGTSSPRPPAVVGLGHGGKLIDALVEASGPSWLSCLETTRALESVELVADVGWSHTEVELRVQLSGTAAEFVHAIAGPGPSPGMRRFREAAGIYASIALDVQALQSRLTQSQCPVGRDLAGLVAQTVDFGAWQPPPRSLHLAGANIDVDQWKGRIAIEGGLHGDRFLRSLLDQIPGRSFLESTETIAGQKIRRLSVPTFPSFYYLLTSSRLVAAVGRDVIRELVTPGPDAPDAELLAVGLAPAQLPDLQRLLELIGQEIFRMSSGQARRNSERLAEVLRRYELGTLDLTLKGSRLAVRAAIRKRP